MSMLQIPIPGYEGLYSINRSGQVYSILKEKYLNHYFPKNSYPLCGLTKDGEVKNKTIHRMLAIAFIPNPENKRYVNHLDGNKRNFLLDNLAWCTASENMYHAHANNLISKEHYQRRMDETKAKEDAGLVEFRVWVTQIHRIELNAYHSVLLKGGWEDNAYGPIVEFIESDSKN